jgi:hypothetical protein
MERLKVPAAAKSGSPESRRGSAVAVSRKLSDPLPKISNRLTDVEIPKLWSAWVPDGKPRELRRPLTDSERGLLEARRDELAPVLVPVAPGEIEAIAIALAAMFSSFRSLRQTDSEAESIIENSVHALREYPAWAIVEACLDIQRNGVCRGDKFDRQWPPNDSEIIVEVRKRVALYDSQFRSAIAMLAAEVER